MPTAKEISDFVDSVVAWDAALQSCADAALAAAKNQFTATPPTITPEQYKEAVSNRAAVADAGADMSLAAMGAIAKIGADQYQPVVAATQALAKAVRTVAVAERAVTILVEVASASVSVVAAVTTPSAASIAGAAAAVGSLVSDLSTPPAQPPAGGGAAGAAG